MEQPQELSASEYTIGKRLNKKTIKGYQSKLNTMSVILLEHDLHEYLDPESSKPVIPLPNNVIEDLFGWISTNTDIPLRFRKDTKEGDMAWVFVFVMLLTLKFTKTKRNKIK
jgi:hypothetical protein